MLCCPRVFISVFLPLCIDIQIGHMVGFWDVELFTHCVFLKRLNLETIRIHLPASSSRPLGRKKIVGTESIETIVSISSEQFMSQEVINILDIAGSIGNSTINRPLSVSLPVLSIALRIHNEYIELSILSCKMILRETFLLKVLLPEVEDP